MTFRYRTTEKCAENRLERETQACKERETDKKRYRGWYDVGGVRKAAFFTSRYAQYTRRFNLMKFPVALDNDFIAFSPKKRFTEKQIKALLAYLNSSFGQFQVERKGRATGGGMLSLEVDYATDIAVPNVMNMRDGHIQILANAFEGLESEARKLVGPLYRVHAVLKHLCAVVRCWIFLALNRRFDVNHLSILDTRSWLSLRSPNHASDLFQSLNGTR